MKTRFEKKEMLPSRPRHLRVVEGDSKGVLSFDALFDRFAPYVAAVALRLIGDDDDIDDIVQEVFFDCARQIGSIQDMVHAKRWLSMVTVRKTRRLLRKRKLLGMLRLPLGHQTDPPMPGATADDKASVIHLFSLLEKLPVNHRIAWSLRRLEGAELTEVAAACGCSVATAKRWIRTAELALTGETNG